MPEQAVSALQSAVAPTQSVVQQQAAHLQDLGGQVARMPDEGISGLQAAAAPTQGALQQQAAHVQNSLPEANLKPGLRQGLKGLFGSKQQPPQTTSLPQPSPHQQQPSQQPQNRLGGLMSFGKKQLSPPSAQGQIAQGAGA